MADFIFKIHLFFLVCCYIFGLAVTIVLGVLEEDCNMQCSNVFQRVCGKTTAWDGTVIISSYHNICHLNKIKCRLKAIAEVNQVPNEDCIEKTHEDTRRVLDFGIVGAHQACNHTCPTYCVDTYEPVCAQVWHRGMKKYNFRTMVNHCHVDLFSCSVGVNVTITPLAKCFANPAGLLFMSQMAAMKSLGFLGESQIRRSSDANLVNIHTPSHVMNSDLIESEMHKLLKSMYQKIVIKRLTKPIVT